MDGLLDIDPFANNQIDPNLTIDSGRRQVNTRYFMQTDHVLPICHKMSGVVGQQRLRIDACHPHRCHHRLQVTQHRRNLHCNEYRSGHDSVAPHLPAIR